MSVHSNWQIFLPDTMALWMPSEQLNHAPIAYTTWNELNQAANDYQLVPYDIMAFNIIPYTKICNKLHICVDALWLYNQTCDHTYNKLHNIWFVAWSQR